MGLSRNKVAVPEGAAGTPPFWRELESKVSVVLLLFILNDKDRERRGRVCITDKVELKDSPIAQLVRALH